MSETPSGPTDQTAPWRQRAGLAPEAELTADLFLRSLSPPVSVHDTQVEFIDRLSELSAAGRLNDLRVSVWGDRLCLCETCAETGAGRAALDRVEEFEGWIDGFEADASLPFEQRVVSSEYAGSAQEVLVPPFVLLALYTDGDLVAVFPHSAAGERYSVGDALDSIDGLLTDHAPTSGH
jgi:hypothetical protein